ncbi:hypothetical protein NIES4075_20760 [Tolypothrix sp. NIES-4075]|uniref:hypothetical protein n=1 Tax=Tolypothrix sp. NIES-4075 TaxID=2005459 RepID=UPI000B5C67A8|nr:hypothetical protein [Tolypothrix sp. NIES-4075]GAX41107.1 hypothetical protein NIES4075_20760 [Tolypothrix sp. NIES-4075]
MVKTIQVRDISVYELKEKSGLPVIKDTDYFREGTENLLALTDGEKQAIAFASVSAPGKLGNCCG